MTEIPQTALLARQMYLDGKPVSAILAATKLSHEHLYRALDGLPQADGGSLLPPMQRRRIIVRKASRAGTRVALVTRMMRATELQLHKVEQRLEAAGYEPGEEERNARALAMLARTVRELTALDEKNAKPGRANESGADDEPVPLDIDELRRSLSRKLDAILAERKAAVPGVADA